MGEGRFLDCRRHRQWLSAFALAALVALAYFLAARVGLALLSEGEGVAVFWPASGVAVGVLIAVGPRARWPVAAGVLIATIAANLLGDRTLTASALKGVCNAGEAVLTGWVVERWFGHPFALDGMNRVVGLLAVSGFAAAVAAVGGAVTMHIFYRPAPLFDIWQSWFLSDGVGIIAVAPVLIGVADLARGVLPSRRELLEGTGALVLLAALNFYVLSLSRSSWITLIPVSALFPLLLWVAARYHGVFAAAATFIIALNLVWTTTAGIGHFGDATFPVGERTAAAQAASLISALCALLLAALFTERRRAEALLTSGKERLHEINEQLRLALGAARLGTFSVEPETGRLECDQLAAQIHGHNLAPRTLEEGKRFIEPEDLRRFDAFFGEIDEEGGIMRTEYRVVHPLGSLHARGERWVALEGCLVRDVAGQPPRLLGVTRDITEQKLAEQRLHQQRESFARLLGALPAAIYTTDAAGHVTYCNEAAVRLWGRSPELGRDKWFDLVRYFLPDGAPMPHHACPTAIAPREGRAVCGREAILERPDGARIFIAPHPAALHDESGAIIGVVNMMLDISARKRAELMLAERVAQLTLAERAALVGSYAYDIRAGTMEISAGYAAIHDLPEGTKTIMRHEWRAHVHPEDLARIDAQRSHAFAERQTERSTEYRILRPGGEARWIESRSLLFYSRDGEPLRMLGVNIDVTERKRAEAHNGMLMGELDHRVKNVLSCVSVIARHSRQSCRSIDEFLDDLDGRIHSLANTHTLLSRGRWQGVGIDEVVRGELAPWAGEGNTTVAGPDVILTAEATQAVAMVLHELVTNATKYGAFSTTHGRVSVVWRWQQNGALKRHLVFEWQELGGPPVAPFAEPGYGTSVIRDLIPYELGGAVDLSFDAVGVRCTLRIPASWVAERNSRFPGVADHAVQG